ncbi:uncharacterized protein LOC126962193 [Macaca thibetana thibetana]|uniref:uncharacterized protein LOC126962193 n=1 Tax=Macaca thibetana thibetana TaxID=257877 RepID=UPI0021BCF365|nr:uncharacterized protein LOC126962193 [Macaca thibetana thibetana]
MTRLASKSRPGFLLPWSSQRSSGGGKRGGDQEAAAAAAAAGPGASVGHKASLTRVRDWRSTWTPRTLGASIPQSSRRRRGHRLERSRGPRRRAGRWQPAWPTRNPRPGSGCFRRQVEPGMCVLLGKRKPAQARRSREWWGESKKRRCAGRLPPPPHSAPSPAPASTSRDPEPPTATTTFSPVEKTPDCSEITIGWGDRWMPPEKKKGWRQPSRRPWVSRVSRDRLPCPRHQ